MSKATLPTNFKDDILASSMGSKRRYNVINNSDGTISLEDVTDYTQVGSTFGAAQINATNKAANAAADASKIIDDYDTLMANTQAGYMAGALAVKELNNNLKTLKKITGSCYNQTDFTVTFDSKPELIALVMNNTAFTGIYCENEKKGGYGCNSINKVSDTEYTFNMGNNGTYTIYYI